VIALFALLLLMAAPIYGQDSGQTAKPHQEFPATDLPSVKLIFAEPNTDSPVQMPSTVMNGPPTCGPEHNAFIQFLTPPPYYNNKVIYSISPDGMVVHYPVEQIVGLTNSYVIFVDPGVTRAVVLLQAQKAGDGRQSPVRYYMAEFDYEGKLQHYTNLDLGFEPVEVVQLSDDGFLVSGADAGLGRSAFVLIDSNGTIQRDFKETSLMPSDKDLTGMLTSMNFVGMNPKDMPPSIRLTAVLSLFKPVHSMSGVLMVEPGAGARVIEILRSGDTRTVVLDLPAHQIAQSVIVSKKGWFVRTSLQDSETQWNLYQVDPETGQAIKRIDTSGVPSINIACSTDSGFYGFRWIDKKPYLIRGDFR
jgi:hypothetical protein